MSWTLSLLVALLLQLGSPDFDPEVGCLDPTTASSPLCATGPWAELLPGPAAVRAQWLFAMSGLHEALGDDAAAATARAAAEEALELALTDRELAHSWLGAARDALAAARDGSTRRSPVTGYPSDNMWAPGTEPIDPAGDREALARARESLR